MTDAAQPSAQAASAAPVQPPAKTKSQTVGYLFAAMFIALSQALGQGFLSANIPTLAGELGASISDTTWLMVAFMAPRAALPLILIKVRTQYGLRRFAEVSIVVYAVVAGISLFATDLRSALLVELLSGISAAPLSTLAFMYMLEPLSPAKKLSLGLPLALTFISLGTPMGRALSPLLLENGSWQNLLIIKLGMSMTCLALVFRLPLISAEKMKVIERLDLISFALITAAFSGFVACFTMGATYWWTSAPWIGVVMAGSISALVAAFMIELQRKAPLVDVRWLLTPEMLQFTAALFVFRIILSEQSSGAPGLFRALGYSAAQMAPLFWVISGATLAGGVACCLVLAPQRVPLIHLVSLALIAFGAHLDSQANLQIAPSSMYFSQALVGFAAALFLPSAMAVGLLSALQRGPQYILSFIIVFLSSQILGATIGSGVFRTLISVRTMTNAQWFKEQLITGDPMLNQHMVQIGLTLSHRIGDITLLKAQTATQLGTAVSQLATLAAYQDVFHLISLLALFAMVVLVGHCLLIAIRKRLAAMPPVSAQ
jgi:MFS family permease